MVEEVSFTEQLLEGTPNARLTKALIGLICSRQDRVVTSTKEWITSLTKGQSLLLLAISFPL